MANGRSTTDEAVDGALDAAPALAGLTVTEAQRPAVRTHLSVGLAIAERIDPTGAEAAPVFRA